MDEHVWKLQNVKRTTGLHPDGTFIIPEGMEILDFTPVHYPANNIESGIITTHFDYYALFDSFYKFDVLTHDTPSMLRRLEQLTGVNPETIPLNDEKTMKLFSEGKTCGVLKFYTDFIKGILLKTGVHSFDDLIRISGLSRGMDVWIGNGEYDIQEGNIELSDIISTRDDITLYLEKMDMGEKKPSR